MNKDTIYMSPGNPSWGCVVAAKQTVQNKVPHFSGKNKSIALLIAVAVQYIQLRLYVTLYAVEVPMHSD